MICQYHFSFSSQIIYLRPARKYFEEIFKNYRLQEGIVCIHHYDILSAQAGSSAPANAVIFFAAPLQFRFCMIYFIYIIKKHT